MNYLTLLEVADLLADVISSDDITAGCIDTSLTETIGVYQREPFTPRECVGGNSSYETTKIKLLVRWGNNPTVAERKAAEIAESVRRLREISTADHIIKFTDVKAVRAIGKDEKGICEYTIDADIIYSERNE